MKKKLIILIFIFVFGIPCVVAKEDTSFSCLYSIPGEPLNMARAGTLSCDMGYHYGFIIKNATYKCTWTTSTGASIWVDERGTASFDLDSYLKTGTTVCPKYVSVQTSSSFYEQTFEFNNGVVAYFSNTLDDIQKQTAIGGLYYGYTAEKNDSQEINDFLCNNYTMDYFTSLFLKFDNEISTFKKNKCDSFTLSEEEKKNKVAFPETFRRYEECENMLTYSDSFFNSELDGVKNRQVANQCLSEDDYQNVISKLTSYKATYNDLRTNLKNGFNNTNNNDQIGNNDNNHHDKPNYSVTDDADIGGLCDKSQYRKPMKFLGIILSFFKIIVPIVIVALGVMDLYKAVTASKEDEIRKAFKAIMVRVIAGVFVFLLPGLVQFVLNMVNEWSDYKNDWCCCTDCLLNPDCDVNSCSSDSCHIEGTND